MNDKEISKRIKNRERKIRYTAITSILAKILSMLIPLVTVRYALNYLGAEIYGLWNTVLSFFSMFAFADLGLGSGLQTTLSQAQGRDDMEESRRLVSSTYVILVISSTIIVIIILGIYGMIDWKSLMNVQSDVASQLVGKVVLIIVLSKLINIPFSLVNRTQLALQEGYRGNIWQCFANMISILLIIVVVKWDIGKVSLIVVSTYAIVLVSILNFIVYFRVQRKELAPALKYADRKTAKRMLKIGVAFCLLSVFTNIGLSLDSFIVAKVSSLEEAATYSIIYRATGLISVGCGMLSAPLWGAFGEALERKDYFWVKERCKKTAVVSLAISMAGTVFLLVFGRLLFAIWLGKSIAYSNSMLFGMCMTQCLLSFIAPYFMILNARGIVIKQIAVFCVYTVISVFLKFVAGGIIGIQLIPIIGAICYGLIVVPFVHIEGKRQIK